LGGDLTKVMDRKITSKGQVSLVGFSGRKEKGDRRHKNDWGESVLRKSKIVVEGNNSDWFVPCRNTKGGK